MGNKQSTASNQGNKLECQSSTLVNTVQLNLLAKLAEIDGNLSKSTFFSPLSIYTCLVLLAEGLSGASKKELIEFLHLQSDPQTDSLVPEDLSSVLKAFLCSESKTFSMANSLWLAEGLDLVEAYAERVSTIHNAKIDSIPMNDTGKAKINNWVKERTDGLIKKFLEKLEADTLLVIINAIFFKGTWKETFDVSLSRTMDFHASEGSDGAINLMFMKKEFKTRYLETKGNQLVCLPFNEDGIVFVASMPRKGNIYDPLSTLRVSEVQDAPSAPLTLVELEMPKFKFEKKYDIKAVLKAMGVQEIFTQNGNDDFSGIFGDGDASVSEVIQKAVIELDEKGAKAASATAVMVAKSRKVKKPKKVKLTLDRPFGFFLMDEASRVILFAGVYRGPE